MVSFRTRRAIGPPPNLTSSRHTSFLEKAEPVDVRALFRSTCRLGFLCDNLGETDAAIGYYETAFKAGSKLEDIPYSDLGTMLNNVALIYRRTGRQKRRSLIIFARWRFTKSSLGPDHPDVASVLNNLAVFYTNERRFAEAEKTHLRALAIREKAHPPTHPDIAQSKCNLAVVYHSNGDYARASELYRASIKTWEEATEKPPEDYESRGVELRRSLALVRQSAAGESARRTRAQEARPVADLLLISSFERIWERAINGNSVFSQRRHSVPTPRTSRRATWER